MRSHGGLRVLLAIGCMGLGACIGNIGGGTDRSIGSDAAPVCDAEAAALTPAPVRRLEKLYVENAVREFLSPLTETSRETLLAALTTRFDLIPNDHGEVYSSGDDRVEQDHVDGIFGLAMWMGDKIAEEGAAYATYATELLAVCGADADKTTLADDACLTTFLEYYGRKAFRRPLAGAEIDDLRGYYQEAVARGVDPLAALVARLVAHPNFYYRFDHEGERLAGTEGTDATYRLDRWELLSKITFLFWTAPPDDALYDRVADTDITEDDALRALLGDVLSDPRAERGILRFYRDWWLLEQTPQPASAGNVSAGKILVSAAGLEALPTTHRDDMIQEVLDLAKHYTFSVDGTLQDILTSQYSFATTPELAAIYGVEAWDGDPANLVPLPVGERSGLLTRAALVASNTEYTRPIPKGKRLLTRLLCTDIPPPPPDANIEPLVHAPDRTTREDIEAVTADAKCGSCHRPMNALGFATENYDPLGRFRKTEMRFAEGTDEVVAELPVDTHVVVPLGADEVEANDGIDLAERIALSGEMDACMIHNYFEYVAGRAPDDVTDGCDMAALHEKLTTGEGTIKAMLVESAMLQSFRQRMVK